MANWSEEIFTIHEVHPSDTSMYRLVDDLGEVLDGTFYEPELQKVSVPGDTFTAWNQYFSVSRWADERRLWWNGTATLQVQQLDRCQGRYKDSPRICRCFIRTMTDESTTEASTTAVIEDAAEDSTDGDQQRQHSLASLRYRVSGHSLIHGHLDQHLQPDNRSREFKSVDGPVE